jgi:hypothetical protein
MLNRCRGESAAQAFALDINKTTTDNITASDLNMMLPGNRSFASWSKFNADLPTIVGDAPTRFWPLVVNSNGLFAVVQSSLGQLDLQFRCKSILA